VSKRDAQADLALLKAATPGPWKHDDRSGCTAVRTGETPGLSSDNEDIICHSARGAKFNGSYWDMDAQTRKNFAFIAACPEMVEHWINRAVEAEKAVRAVMALRAARDAYRLHSTEANDMRLTEAAETAKQSLDRIKEVLSHD
jgi:hypothetical protein